MNKLSKDIIISTAFSFFNVLFNFWLIKEAEFTLSVVHLGVFLYVRRIAPTFSNFSQLGTSQALIRFTSIDKDNKSKLKIYYILSISIWILMSGILLGIYALFHTYLSGYFPEEIAEEILKITFVYISILHLSYIILPYFLNLRKIFTYNMIQLLIASLILLFVFKFFTIENDLILLFKNALSVIVLLLLLLLTYIIITLKLYIFPRFQEIKTVGKDFIEYGLPRSIITFSDMFLLTVGAMMIHGKDEIIGGFLIGITLSRTILIVLQPVSLLSAVISGHKNSEERHETLVNLLVGGTLYIAILTSVVLFNWVDVLLPLWLKNEEIIVLVVFIFKLLSLGLVPYAIFQVLKGIIEVKFFKPLNLISLAIAIATHVVMYYSLKSTIGTIEALSISLMCSFVLLGFFSLYWNRKYLKSHKYFKIIPLLALNVLLFLINFAIHDFYPNFLGFVISGFISSILFLAYSIKIKSPFIKEAILIFKK
ncbi:hypothetical protein IMCC3317_28420 [Kordia antarctica]|uniref:Polysaccharide biosynthesis protein C-terminal domain-containing protein n=1 Tax=Kordia antarctica TaxID=1218801 RepID=A0A7L4ZL68_9FLAO|nr:hypothetical protein [Kordia antarctica]QHI37463.1 hypothetical protein IMCC3317_28420 [Kordia antarctica]